MQRFSNHLFRIFGLLGPGARRRAGGTIVVALSLLATTLVAVAPATAVPVGISPPSQPNIPLPNGDTLIAGEQLAISVWVDGAGARKVQLVGERSEPGSGDWSHPSNSLPYYSALTTTSNSTATFVLQAGTLQPGYDYRFRARQWYDGDGGNPTEFGPWQTATAMQSFLDPVAPYPLSPKGPTPPSANILRADNSAKPSSSPITSYQFEIKTLHTPWNAALDADPVWSKTVPYNPAGVTEAALDECQQIPRCTGSGTITGSEFELRWRVRSVGEGGETSEWSRWRYFDTRSTQMDFWYIPNRAGSYSAGPAGGDEASGLTASQQYPGVFWFIRDAGGDEDRAKLYAIKIDPQTGRLENIDGRVTKEIKVNGVENVDWEAVELGPDGNLWIGDIGDYYRKDDPNLPEAEAAGQMRDRNSSSEPDLRVIRVPEPNPYTDSSVTASKIAPYQFPDGESYNSEAMFFVGDYLHLITKEQPQKVYRFRSWISSSQDYNTLNHVGQIQADLDPITDISANDDFSILALTTAAKRAVVFRDAPSATPSNGTEAEALVRRILLDKDPAHHYYYRDAGVHEASGTLTTARPEPGPNGQYRQTTMQVEGIAIAGNDLAMISEFGKHVLYVPRYSANDWWGWSDRYGAGNGPIAEGIVNPPGDGVLIPFGAEWHYKDDGIEPVGFEDVDYVMNSSWQRGHGQLGAGGNGEITTINRSSPYHVTDYFRNLLVFEPTDDIPARLKLDLTVDDGAVVYINGLPVARHNMANFPSNPSHGQEAVNSVWGSAEEEVHTFIVEDPPLRRGLNVVAVEVHQADQGSSDTSFDLRMIEDLDSPPVGFEVLGHHTEDGLDMSFAWQPVDGVGGYRIERRDLTVAGPTWTTFAEVDAGTTDHSIDTNYSVELADYRLVALFPEADSAPTLGRRIVYVNDPMAEVDESGYIYADFGGDITVTPVPVTPTELADQGLTMGGTLTAAGTVALFDGPWPGPADVAAALGVTVVGGGVILLAVNYDQLILDGQTIPRDSTDTGGLKYPYRASSSAMKSKLVLLIAGTASLAAMSAAQADHAAKQCVELVESAWKSGNPVPAGPGKEHPCEYLPLYFPSAGSAAVPAELRYDAITVRPEWVLQRRRSPVDRTNWYTDTGWPEGAATTRPNATHGCLTPKPNGPAWPAANSWECDEFPNQSMKANTRGAAAPQPALRWATRAENGTTTGGEAWSLNRIYNECVQADNDPFLVLPLTDDTKPPAMPLPPSFHICP